MAMQTALVPRQIIVVDDDTLTLGFVVRALSMVGHRVTACASFEAGSAALEQSTPEIVIVDVRLGGYNGLQLIMQAKHRNPQAEAIAITGFDDLDLRNEAAKMGATFLTKPFSASALQGLVERLTNESDSPKDAKPASRGTVIWNAR
jgi:DNA-binding NtrC family response regulator